MPHIILFDDVNFKGGHKHVFQNEAFLDDFNDRASSLIVLEGVWQCFEDANFAGRQSMQLGPGLYPQVDDPQRVNIDNDSISSVKHA